MGTNKHFSIDSSCLRCIYDEIECISIATNSKSTSSFNLSFISVVTSLDLLYLILLQSIIVIVLYEIIFSIASYFGEQFLALSLYAACVSLL